MLGAYGARARILFLLAITVKSFTPEVHDNIYMLISLGIYTCPFVSAITAEFGNLAGSYVTILYLFMGALHVSACVCIYV